MKKYERQAFKALLEKKDNDIGELCVQITELWDEIDVLSAEIANAHRILDELNNCECQEGLMLTERLAMLFEAPPEEVIDNGSVLLLVNFLNLNVGSTLIVEGGVDGKDMYVNHDSRPTQSLMIRTEVDRNLTYIDAAALKVWLTQRGYDFNQFKNELTDAGVLLETNLLKNLSVGCSTISTGASKCLLFDTSRVYK